MTDAIQVFTTTGSRDQAQQIAQGLIEARLAACVQVSGPITSTYRWQGQVESADEFLCVIKTDQAHYAAVEETIRRLHSYEVPEILAVPVIAGNPAYLKWLAEELK